MDIVYEDEALLVVNKPSGLVVNRSKTWKGETLQTQIEEYLDLDDLGVGERAGIVHRLDKETSGLLLVAKEEPLFFDLQKQFKERYVSKSYNALVHGEMTPAEAVIDAPIGRNPKNGKKFAVVEGACESLTHYEVLYVGERKDETFSYLDLSPRTGRTHQIRVHLAAFRHPVVGDSRYAGRKRARQDRIWCTRLFLHAYYIKFFYRRKGKDIEFEIGIPEKLYKIWEEIDFSYGS